MMRMTWLIVTAVLLSAGCGGTEVPDSSNPGSVPAPSEEPTRSAVALPDDLPDDVPIYPGSTPVHVGTSAGGIRQSPGTSIQLETGDPVESVQEFYAGAMQEHSWTMDLSTPTLLNGRKDERYLNVTITEMPSQPGTVRISVIYNRPEAGGDASSP